MITIDTNILIRYLISDDKQQTEKVAYLFTHNHCFVPVTVTLEVAWVLGAKSIGLNKTEIIASIRHLFSLPCLTFQYQNELINALNWAQTSMDIADAIHLAIAQQQQALPIYSFDKRFVSKAQQLKDMSSCCQLPQ